MPSCLRLFKLLRSPILFGRTLGACFLVLMGFAGQARASIAFVQSNSTTPQSPQTAAAVVYTLAQTAGNLDVVVVGWNDSTATVISVMDTKGNAYAVAAAPVVQSGTATQAIYYAKNIASAAAGANTVTVTFSVAAVFPDIRIAEYSGLDTANPLDVAVGAQGTTTATSNSGSVATTNGNDLLVGANVVQSITTGAGAGFTNRIITPDGDILEDRVVTVTGSYSATAALDRVQPWVMQMVAFRAAGSGGTGPSITSLNPTSGQVNTTVTITGTNFGSAQGANTVTFNGTSAGTASTWNATTIVVTVPTGATTGNVVVTVGGLASNGVNFTVTGPPASITPTAGTPQSATVNTAFAIPLQATVRDAANNLVSGVVVKFTTQGSGASGTLAGGVNTATTNTSGVATSAVFTANATAGGPYNVVASATGPTSANFSLTNTVGPAAKVVVTSGSGQSASINTAFGAPLVATVTDAGNNPVGNVTVTFRAPGSGASGTFAGGVNTATTNTSGVATAATFTANGTAGGPYTVTASAPGAASPANFSLTNLAPSSLIALVQHRSLDDGTTTSSSLAFNSNNTAGNWIGVVIRAGKTGQVFTVTDSRGNTYRRAIQFNETIDSTTLGIFYAENIASGANTITVSDTITGTMRYAILEYSGVAMANSLDGAAVAGQGTDASPKSGILMTTANGDLVLGETSTANPASFTAGSGYLARDFVPAEPNTKLLVEDQIQAVSGNISANASLGASDNWGAAVAAFKSAATVTPPTFTPPSNLVAAPSGPVQVNLSWTAATETGGTITNYLVERCTGAACNNVVQIGTSATTAYSDTSASLTGSTTYNYRVRATDGTNFSAYSNTASATTAAPTFTAPSNLAATSAGSTQINLSWTAATEIGGTITSYIV